MVAGKRKLGPNLLLKTSDVKRLFVMYKWLKCLLCQNKNKKPNSLNNVTQALSVPNS